MELVERRLIDIINGVGMYMDVYDDNSEETFQYIRLNGLSADHFRIDRRYRYWSDGQKQDRLSFLHQFLKKTDSENCKESIRRSMDRLIMGYNDITL